MRPGPGDDYDKEDVAEHYHNESTEDDLADANRKLNSIQTPESDEDVEK